MVADLQTMFTTERRRRSIPVEAFRELESGLRTKKPGPRNRTVSTRQFIRRDARLSRVTSAGHQLGWRVTTYNDTAIDGRLLDGRYGPDSGVSMSEEPRETVDLDPSRIFGDDSRELLRDMETKGWPSRRLSGLLAREPEAVLDPTAEPGERRSCSCLRPGAAESPRIRPTPNRADGSLRFSSTTTRSTRAS